jgi:hypothetical protein
MQAAVNSKIGSGDKLEVPRMARAIHTEMLSVKCKDLAQHEALP